MVGIGICFCLVQLVKKKMMKRLAILFSVLGIAVSAMAQIKSDSPWHIFADNIDPNRYFGVTCANGMIGLVSSPEPMKVKDVVLNGVYDNYQRGRVSNILKSFNHINMNLDVDGQRVGRANISNYRQVLDMQQAELQTTFDVGDKLQVTHRLLALRHLPYTAMVWVEITAKKEVTITPMSVIEAPDHLSDVRNFYAEIDRPHVTIGLLTSLAKSPSGQQTVAASNSFLFTEPHGSEPRVLHEDWDYNLHLAKFHLKLRAGQTYRFGLVGSAVASTHFADPQNEAERLTIFAKLEGYERLLRRHRAEWARLWESDIEVEGDLAAQRDIRLALYHLYAFAREGTGYSLSPMGLSGLGYNGHVFWDTELWMYPPLLLLQPDIARSLLDYRFNRLEAARRNAFSHGYQGAMYPWESSASGAEDTPVWALTGPFQHHITGDVAWAHWKYYQVTQDLEWLRTKGWPVIKAAAEFWVSRVERNGPGRYDINNVIGANEWQENVDNNAFTNGMAITSLRIATQAAKQLGLSPDPDWTLVAANIPILRFPDGVTRENATYNGEVIKQADVNLLAFPLDIITDPATIRKDLAYYTPRMAKDGPAMGNSVLAALQARLGDSDQAYALFKKSYEPNKVPPFGVLAETANGTNPYFATGAGGMLQAVLMGVGGLQINDQGITQLKVKLPREWKSLTLKGVGPAKKTYVLK